MNGNFLFMEKDNNIIIISGYTLFTPFTVWASLFIRELRVLENNRSGKSIFFKKNRGNGGETLHFSLINNVWILQQ